MFIYSHTRQSIFKSIVCGFVAFVFMITGLMGPSSAAAQVLPSILNLPIPGTMVAQSPAFVPVLLKGMTVHPDNPLQFDFIIDSGNENLPQTELKKESERLVKYFLASMTVPQNDLWVNLSPYEKDRIVPEELGKTELGRDLLAQDYILKQLTATMMYPEEELGKKFWDRVYKIAKDQYGITEIPTETFNKVWILPEKAEVYEHENTVYITDSYLKVMLDADYLAMQENQQLHVTSDKSEENPSSSPVTRHLSPQKIYSEIIREIIIPEIEKEVNTGKNFAPLRQIYHSLILAKWYKQTVKNSIMSQVYIDQNKVAGIEIGDAQMKENIYDRYMQAYKKGVFNYIKEDYDGLSQTVIPRQYFSGGFKDEAAVVAKTDNAIKVANTKVGNEYKMPVNFHPEESGSDEAMLTVSVLNGPRSIDYTAMQDAVLSGREAEKAGINLEVLNKIFSEVVNTDDLAIKIIGGLLNGDIAVSQKNHEKQEYFVSVNLAHELLSDSQRAKTILKGLLMGEKNRRSFDDYYSIYKEEYRLIKEDLKNYQALIAEGKDPQNYYLTEYLGLLRILNDDPEIFQLFDEVIDVVENLEESVNALYENSQGVDIGTRDIVDVVKELYVDPQDAKDPQDPTFLRNKRINKAFVTADADYFGNNAVQKLKARHELAGTFLESYVNMLGHRGTAQGREAFFFLAKDPITVVPFSQTKNIYSASPDKFDGIYDDFAKRQYYAFHGGRRFSSGIGATEAENPENIQQRWHVHETNQKFTTSLSDNTQLRYGHEATRSEEKTIKEWESTKGELNVYRNPEDEKKILFATGYNWVIKLEVHGEEKYLVIDHEEQVPYGSMIAMPKAIFHTIRNISKDQKGIDFTIKDPVTQLIKTFSPPKEVSVSRPMIIAPNLIDEKDWGKIAEQLYLNPYNMRMNVDDHGRMKYAFDEKGNPVPTMGNPLYMKLRIVEVKPGKTTDSFEFRALEEDKENLEIIRIFPWPKDMPHRTGNPEMDWYLYRDHKKIKANVIVTRADGEETVNVVGGDLVLLDNKKADGDIKSFKVANNSEDQTLVFYVIEPSQAVPSLLPYFNNDLEKLSNQIEVWKKEFKGLLDKNVSTSQILSMEFFRITDENAQDTGEVMPRDLVHAKIANGEKAWHRTGGVFLVNSKGEVLFQIRADDKPTKPGAYDISVGGHLGLDNPREGMIREIEEEVFDSQYQIGPDRLYALTEDGEVVKNEEGAENASFFVYLVEDDEMSKIKMQKKELKGIEWRDSQEIEDLLVGYNGYNEKSFDPYAAGFIYFEEQGRKDKLIQIVNKLRNGKSISDVAQDLAAQTDQVMLTSAMEEALVKELLSEASIIPGIEDIVREKIEDIKAGSREFKIEGSKADDYIQIKVIVTADGIFIYNAWTWMDETDDRDTRTTIKFIPNDNNQAAVVDLERLTSKIMNKLSELSVLPRSKIDHKDIDTLIKFGIVKSKKTSEVVKERIGFSHHVGAHDAAVNIHMSFQNIGNEIKINYEIFKFAEGSQSANFVISQEKSMFDSNKADEAVLSDPGGIDMNEIDIDRQTSAEAGVETHTIQFDMQGMEPLLNMNIQGFSPVIIDMIPINSVLPLLGLMPLEKGIRYGKEEAQEELEQLVSSSS